MNAPNQVAPRPAVPATGTSDAGRTTVVVVGAGHAGLAMSHRLTERSVDHVVLERGAVANSWRTQRWDSLRLLSPTWHARLPGVAAGGLAGGHDPDGYLSAAETAAMIDRYAAAVGAPVVDRTTVERVGRPASGRGYEVVTDRGVCYGDAVVLASGGCVAAPRPAVTQGLDAEVVQHSALTYRNPDQVRGGVLVVGAGATGVQVAEEVARRGRPVSLAVGEHVRMPRTYRGRDIFWWTETARILAESYEDVDDVVRARHLASPQLIGTDERRSIDLTSLQRLGVRVLGRLGRVRDGVAQFSGGLRNVCHLADLKLDRLLQTLDDTATDLGIDDDVGPPERFAPTAVPSETITEIDLARDGIGTVIWATGLAPDHRYLDLPVFDHKGHIRHDGGIVADAPGVYVLGLNLLRRRGSSFIGGAGADTAELADHLHAHLDALAPTTGRGWR